MAERRTDAAKVADDWVPVAPAAAPVATRGASSKDAGDWTPVETRRKEPISGGERKALADEARVMAEQGFVPEGAKAFAYPALNTALFNVPSHVATTIDLIRRPDASYRELYKQQKEYEEALARRNPTESMAGTGAGIVGSVVTPLGPIGAIGRGAATAAGRFGLGRYGQAAASGAGLGAATTGISEAVEKVPLAETPGQFFKDVGTSAGIGTVAGGVLGPAVEKVATKFAKQPEVSFFDPARAGVQKLSPESEQAVKQAFPDMSADEISAMTPQFIKKFEEKGISAAAARESLMEGYGIPPSKSMATGIKPPMAAQEAAGETEVQAREKLANAATSLFGVPPPKDATGQDLFQHLIKARDLARTNYEIVRNSSGTFKEEMLTNISPFIRASLNKSGFPTDLSQYPQYSTAARALDMIDTGIGSGTLPLNKPLNIANLDVAYKGINKFWREARDDADKAALNAIREGYKDSIKYAIFQRMFSGDGQQLLRDIENSNLMFQAYKNMFSGKDAGGEIVKRAVDKMRDANGRIPDVLGPEAAEAAAAVVNSGLIDPSKSTVVYKKLETILSGNPAAMESVKRYIRASAFDAKGDITKLPEAVNEFFGKNPELAKKVFTPDEIREAKNLARAVKVATERRVSEEEKNSMIVSALRRATGSLIGTAMTANGGPFLQAAAALAGDAAGAAPKAWTSAAKKRAERAGAPSAKPNISGRGVEIQRPTYSRKTGFDMVPYRVYPGIRDIEAVAPVYTPPGYGLPPEENIGADGSRAPRKAGGRVTTASQLIASVERAKQKVNNTTKPLMKASDDHIAHALAIANRHLED